MLFKFLQLVFINELLIKHVGELFHWEGFSLQLFL